MSESASTRGPAALSGPPLWRDPLLAFAIGAGLIFAAAAWTMPDPSPAPGPDVDDAPISEASAPHSALAAAFEARVGRAPDASERAALLRRWLDDELLYREGRRLGLHQGDPVIRDRVVQAMLGESSAAETPAPDRAELERFFEAHPERYREPARLAFAQIFVGRRDFPDPQAVADELLSKLEGGADPRALPGRFSAGKHFTPARVAGTYGTAVAGALEKLEPGQWSAVAVESGVHLIRLDARDPGGGIPPFARVEARVSRDAADWARSQRRQKQVDALRPYFEIVRVEG